MEQRVFLITHPSQLGALSALPFVHHKGLGALRLGGAVAGHSDRDRWESELNRNFYACGCNTAAAGLLIGLIAGGAWGVYQYATDVWTPGASAGAALGAAIAGAVIGKLVGLVRANSRLKSTVREIRQAWKVDEKPVAQWWTCA